jgi:serine/threonine-protein kinase
MRVAREVACAVGAAHEVGIVHRDLKPDNVMITPTGVAKVLDFGLARHAASDAPEDHTVTEDGRIRGTPSYMSPEQAKGQALDARSDVFSLGIVLYEMFTGGLPFRAGTSAEILASILRDAPRAAPGMGTEIARVVGRCLAKVPAERYATGGELAEALVGVTTPAAVTGVVAAPAPMASTTRTMKLEPGERPRRRWGAVGVVVALAGSVIAFARGHRPVPEVAKRDAVATFGAAMQLWRDASIDQALRRLGEATTIDPAFAEAHLRYALLDDVTPAAREHLQQAAQFRDRLSASDLAILNALEPSLREPADVLETRERLAALVGTSSDDIELLLAIASRYFLAWDGGGALPYAERALRASKEPAAVASLFRARALATLDRFDEARAEYDRCFAHSPSATGCLTARARIDANDGRCESSELLARRLIAIDAASANGHRYLAGALFAQAESLPLARAALEPLWATLTGAEGEWQRGQDETYLNVLAGDFVAAEKSIAAWEQAARSFSDADHHGGPAGFRINMYLELGANHDVEILARRYLDESRAWSKGGSIVCDIEGHRALYLAGATSKTDFDAFRREWLAREDARWRGIYDPLAYKWYEAYVQPVRDADDARLALVQKPVATYDHEVINAQGHQQFGLMYALAGKEDVALNHLRKAASACTFNRPLEQTLAIQLYGQALARAGDAKGACAEYARVLRRWGGEPRSVTASAARVSARELRCGLPEDFATTRRAPTASE